MENIKKLYSVLKLLIGLDWEVIQQLEDFSNRLYRCEQNNMLALGTARNTAKDLAELRLSLKRGEPV